LKKKFRSGIKGNSFDKAGRFGGFWQPGRATAAIRTHGMKEKDLKFFKELLTRWLDELRTHADSTMSGLRESDESLPDPLDRAVFDSERNFTLRIRDRENMLIRKIRKSLQDIEEKAYGICEECGEDIAIERLKARPVTGHCIRCKIRIEAREKLTEI
jgi:DnaK suppressor protein